VNQPLLARGSCAPDDAELRLAGTDMELVRAEPWRGEVPLVPSGTKNKGKETNQSISS